MARKRRTYKKPRNQKKLGYRIIESGDPARALAIPAETAPPARATQQYQGTPQPVAPALVGGRQTQPSNVNPLGLLSYSFLPRRQYQAFNLTDMLNASVFSAQQVLELLADLSPEVSLALWNEVRMVNGGWSYKVMTANGRRELSKGKEALDELIERINPDGGGIDSIIDSLTQTAFLQGAICAELALNEDLSDIEDIYPVQPWTIHFVRDSLQNLVAFQLQQVTSTASGMGYQNAANYGYGAVGLQPFKRLNPVTFSYLPIDAGPDDAYGRPPAAPAIQVIAFDLQVLADLKKAVHMNAYGRLHVKVLEEVLLKNAPPEFSQDPTGMAARNFVNAQVAEIRQAYNSLQPDDALITSDAVEIGSSDFSSKTAMNAQVVLMLIERRLIRALKQLPVLMGSNEGTTETHGTVQMDIYSRGIKSLQRVIANLLEKLLGVALQVLGIGNAKVVWEFEQVRANDRLKDIQADQLQANLLAFMRDEGWITNDDASIQMTGSKAVAEPKPKALPQPTQGQQDDETETDSEDEDKTKKAKPKQGKEGQGESDDAPDDENADGDDTGDEKTRGRNASATYPSARPRFNQTGGRGGEASILSPNGYQSPLSPRSEVYSARQHEERELVKV